MDKIVLTGQDYSWPNSFQRYTADSGKENQREIVVSEDLRMQQWAAYEENHYTRTMNNSIQALASHGTKMPSREAIDLFPLMNPTAWRR